MKERNGKKRNSVVDENVLIVVGIGASAGGLEALQDFFKNMPLNSGLAFVVIQHLSPDYKSLMDELLARYTRIPIEIAVSGTEIQRDHIYLIPPRKNISIFHNQLLLEEQNTKKILNLPIDIFFRSLAIEKNKNAIGIILSGTGSDGTLGTRDIKEAGGMIMVQDDVSAKFDGMPKSSIATGLVDYVLPPSQMPEALINYIKHPMIRSEKMSEAILSQNIDSLTKIIMILRDFTGIDFSSYRENTILRRLEKRISINRFGTLDEYVLFLSESDKEKEVLFRELLIGVTRFFRDIEAFESLKANVFPSLRGKKLIRVWSVGSSTGEEIYSLAILLSEFYESAEHECDIKIFSTDIDRRALDFASQGFYPDSIASDIDPALLVKYFVKMETGYQIKDSIRQMIVFASHNLLKDPPFSKLDILICRNLFIYLKPDVQTRILSMFYYSLNSDGYLFLGSSESIGDMRDAFEAVDSKWKIFRAKSGYNPPILRDLRTEKLSKIDIESVSFNSGRLIPGYGVKFDQITNLLLSEILPPSVIIDSSDNIIHVVKDIGFVVKFNPGRFTSNLLEIIPKDIALFVSALLRRVRRENLKCLSEAIGPVKSLDGLSIIVTVRIIETEKARFFLVSFDKKKKNKIRSVKNVFQSSFDIEFGDRVTELQKELQTTKESLQATVEELETSNEELQSSNEELIASNEELQSTNEELQSVNEELFTVNSEYQAKIEELTRLNNDIHNLLVNTQVGALYLDRNLCIRKLTPTVSRLINIIPGDIGRPIYHFSTVKTYPSMMDDIQKVVDTLQPVDKEIGFPDGRYYLVDLRPYRTDNNAVDGVLLTFIEITKLKNEKERADLLSRYLNSAMNMGQMAWWQWDTRSGKVIMDDHKATMLGYSPDEFPSDVYEICNLIHPEDYDATMQNMRDHLEGRTDAWDCTYRIKRKDGSYAWYYDRGSVTEKDENGKPLSLMGTVIEVSKLKSLEEQLQKTSLFPSRFFTNECSALFICNSAGEFVFRNESATELFNKFYSQIDADLNLFNLDIRITDTSGNITSNGFSSFLSSSVLSPLKCNVMFKSETGDDKLIDFCITILSDKEKAIMGYLFTEIKKS